MVLLVTLVVLMVKQWSTSFVHGVTSQPATIVFGLYTSSDTMYVDNLSIKTFTGSSSVSTLGYSTGKVVAEIMQKTITGSYTLLSADNDLYYYC
jgi:hypothetical protein